MRTLRKHIDRARRQQRGMRRSPYTLQDWMRRGIWAKRLGMWAEHQEAVSRVAIMREERAKAKAKKN